MAEDDRDVLMTIVGDNGPILAECQALIADKDPLGKGFTTTQMLDGSTSPTYFSVEDFTFEVALSPDPTESKENKTKDKADAKNTAAIEKKLKDLNDKLNKQSKAAGGDGSPLKLEGLKPASQFTRFMNTGRSAMRAQTYPADLEKIAISRRMDASSLTLLKACIDSTTFKSATVLKRKAVGESRLRGYLRIDFTSLLITDFDWEDDDVVKESFKFICREAIVTYCVEDDDGTLKKQPTAKWSMLNLTPGAGPT